MSSQRIVYNRDGSRSHIVENTDRETIYRDPSGRELGRITSDGHTIDRSGRVLSNRGEPRPDLLLGDV